MDDLISFGNLSEIKHSEIPNPKVDELADFLNVLLLIT